MNFYDRWLAGIRGSEMFAAVAGTSGAAWTALAQIEPVWPVQVRLLFTGALALVASVLYLRNPKDREWMPASGGLEEMIRALAGPLIQEHLGGFLTGGAGKIVAAILPATVARSDMERPTTPSRPSTPPPVQSASRAAPAPAPTQSVPPAPRPASAPVPETPSAEGEEATLDTAQVLEQILHGQQQTAVALQGILKRMQGGG